MTTWPGALKFATHTSASAAPARHFDLIVVEAENRGHRAGILDARLMHRVGALAHETDPVGVAQRTRRDERGVLAEAVPRAVPRAEAETFDRVEHDERKNERGELGVAGVLEFLGVGIE